jgi:hypothetical protein
MHSLRSKLVRINSKERDPILSTSSSKMVIKFNANDPTISQIHSIALKSASIPNTEGNITLANNSFTFSTGGVPATIPLLTGNYTIATLINSLVTSAQGVAVGMGITVDPISGRLEFTFGISSRLLSTAEGNKLAETLGINLGSLIDVPVFLVEYLPNLIGLENIYIACNELSGGDYMIDSALGQLNVFAHIPVSVPFGSIQHYLTNDQQSDLIKFPADRNLDYLTIILYDDRGLVVDLQGLNWQMILKIYFHVQSTN